MARGEPLGQAYAELMIDSSGFDRGLSTAQRSMAGWSKSMKKMATVAIGVVGVTAVVKQLNKAVDAAMEFDTALRNVWTLTDQSWASMQNLGDRVADLSAEFGKTGKAGLEAMYQIASASFAGADGMKVLEASMEGAVAGLTDVQSQADLLTTILNAYGMAASEATEVNDVLFTVIKRGKTTASELGGAFGRLAAVAAPLGASFEDVAAALMTLTRQGISTDEAVTAVRQAIVQLARPTEDLADVISDLGYSSGVAAIEQDGFAGALANVAQYAEENNLEMTNLFTNIRAVLAILPLAGNKSAEFAEDQKAAAEATGAQTEALEKQKGPAFELAQAQAELNKAWREFGTEILPIVIPKVIELTNRIADLVKWLSGEESGQSPLELLSELLGLEDYPGIGEPVTNLLDSISALTPQAAAGGPLPFVVDMMDATKVAIDSSLDDIQESLQAFYKATGDMALSQKVVIRAAIEKLYDEAMRAPDAKAMADIWQTGLNTLINKWSQIFPEMEKLRDVWLGKEQEAAQVYLDTWTGVASAVVQQIERTVGPSTGWPEGERAPIVERVSPVIETWNNLLSASAEDFEDAFETFWQTLDESSPTVEEFIANIKKWAGKAGDREDILEAMFDAMGEEKDMAEKMVDMAASILNIPVEDAERMVELWTDALGESEKTIEDATDSMRTFAQRFAEIDVSVVGQGVSNLMVAAQQQLLTALETGDVSNLQSAISDIAMLGGSVRQMMDYLERIMTGKFSPKIRAAAAEMYAELKDKGSLLGKTFQKLADEAEEAEEKRQRALDKAARRAEQEARERERRMDANLAHYIDVVSTMIGKLIVAGDIEEAVENLRNLADTDVVLDVLKDVESYVSDRMTIQGIITGDYADIQENLQKFRKAIGDVTDGLGDIDWPSEIRAWGGVVQEAGRQMFGDLTGDLIGSGVSLAASLAAGNIPGALMATLEGIGTITSEIRRREEEARENAIDTFETLRKTIDGVIASAVDVFGSLLKEINSMLDSLVNVSNKLINSFWSLIESSTVYGKLQQQLSRIQGAFMDRLLGFLWPFVAAFSELLTATEETTEAEEAAAESIEETLGDLNVPIGWKYERIAYAASIPDQPPVFGGGEPEEDEPLTEDTWLNAYPQWVRELVKKFKDTIAQYLTPFVNFADTLQNIGVTLAPAIIDAVGPALENFGELLMDLGTRLRENLMPVLLEYLPDALADLVDFFGGAFYGALDAFVTILTNVMPSIADLADVLGGIGEALPDIMSRIAEGITPAIESFLDTLAGIAGDVLEFALDEENMQLVTQGLSTALDFLSAKIEAVANFWTTFLSGTAPALTSFMESLSGIADLLPGLATQLAEALAPVANTIIDAVFTPLADWMQSTLIPDLEGFLAGFTTWWQNIAGSFFEDIVIPDISGWLQRLYDWLKPVVTFLETRVWPWVEKIWNKIVAPWIDEILGMFEEFGRWVSDNWGQISAFLEEWLGDTLDEIGGNLTTFLDNIKAWITGDNPLARLSDTVNNVINALRPFADLLYTLFIEPLEIAVNFVADILQGNFLDALKAIPNAILWVFNSIIDLINLIPLVDIPNIPYLQTDPGEHWRVAESGMAVVHKGETVGRGGDQVIKVYLDGRELHARIKKYDRQANLGSGFAIEGAG